VAFDALGDHPRASAEFKKAIEGDPNYAEAHFNLGLSYFRMGKNQLATQHFEKALALEPRRASGPYTQLGEIYLRQGKNDRAAEAFKKAVAMSKDDGRPNSQAYRGLALAYLGQDKPEQAIQTLRGAVDAFPADASVHAALAEVFVTTGDIDRGLAEYDKRLQLEPGIDAELDLARTYTKKHIAAKAEPLFQKVLKEAPEHRPALLGLADLYLATGNYEAAEKALARALKADPQDTSTLARLGIVHSRRGRPDLAVQELEQVVEKDPTQLEAKAELGSLYARGGDFERALKVLRDVLVADPRQPLGLLYLGQAQYQRGEVQKAAESFKASARVDPNFAEPHYALGQLYEAQHKLGDAQSEYQRAASIQTDHPDAAAAAKRLASNPPR